MCVDVVFFVVYVVSVRFRWVALRDLKSNLESLCNVRYIGKLSCAVCAH